jgi:hypothetical protein
MKERMRLRGVIVLLATNAMLSGCAAPYTKVSPKPVPVADYTMRVQPRIAWNRVPRTSQDVEREENWTQNGPLLDSITFIGALREGEAIAKQRRTDDRQVPAFRADMTHQDLVTMVEVYYRVKAGAMIFEIVSVKPATFLGRPGMQLDYAYVGEDEIRRRGRAVLAVIKRKLYLMALEGTALHYFDAALPSFESMVASASLFEDWLKSTHSRGTRTIQGNGSASSSAPSSSIR